MRFLSLFSGIEAASVAWKSLGWQCVGQQIRGNGFRRVGRITADVGRWLLSAAESLEASPPGTVNLWTMLTERAHGIGGSDAE